MGEELSPLRVSIVDADIEQVESWRAGLGRPLSAREQAFIDGVQRGLDDVRAGRTVSHATVLRDSEERRRRWQDAIKGAA